jgi:hypothetical protein
LLNFCHHSITFSALTSEGSYEHCPPEGDRVMKNTRLTSILHSSLIAGALTIGSLASTQYASAQSSTLIAEVNVPFAFQTANQTLPAGTYRIGLATNHVVRLQGPGHAGGFVMSQDAIKNHAPDHGTVVFDRYGDKYYLRQIWTAGNTVGIECPKGRAEKENQLAKNQQAPDSVELALNSVPKH